MFKYNKLEGLDVTDHNWAGARKDQNDTGANRKEQKLTGALDDQGIKSNFQLALEAVSDWFTMVITATLFA